MTELMIGSRCLDRTRRVAAPFIIAGQYSRTKKAASCRLSKLLISYMIEGILSLRLVEIQDEDNNI